jgi:hypothetical protein
MRKPLIRRAQHLHGFFEPADLIIVARRRPSRRRVVVGAAEMRSYGASSTENSRTLVFTVPAA